MLLIFYGLKIVAKHGDGGDGRRADFTSINIDPMVAGIIITGLPDAMVPEFTETSMFMAMPREPESTEAARWQPGFTAARAFCMIVSGGYGYALPCIGNNWQTNTHALGCFCYSVRKMRSKPPAPAPAGARHQELFYSPRSWRRDLIRLFSPHQLLHGVLLF